jgi:hypothetical protein
MRDYRASGLVLEYEAAAQNDCSLICLSPDIL